MANDDLSYYLQSVPPEWIATDKRYYAQDSSGAVHSFSEMPARYENDLGIWQGVDKRKLDTTQKFVGWHNCVVSYDGTNISSENPTNPVKGKYMETKPVTITAHLATHYPERAFTEMPSDFEVSRIYNAKAINAQSRNIRFDMGFQEFGEIVTNKVCCITGVTLDHTSNPEGTTRFSLDRIDPALGYVKGNVVVMASNVNKAKSDLDKFLTSGLDDEYILKVLYKAEYAIRKRIKKAKEAKAALDKEQGIREEAFRVRYGILPTTQRG